MEEWESTSHVMLNLARNVNKTRQIAKEMKDHEKEKNWCPIGQANVYDTATFKSQIQKLKEDINND